MVGIGADIDQCSSIAVVVVDANNLATVVSSCAFHINVPLTLAATVPTRSVYLAVVFSVKVDDVDGAAAIVLDDLV